MMVQWAVFQSKEDYSIAVVPPQSPNKSFPVGLVAHGVLFSLEREEAAALGRELIAQSEK